MIILKSCGSHAWGGLEIYCLNSSAVQKELGHEISLLCLPGTDVYDAAVRKGLNPLPILRKGISRIGAIWKLARYLRKNKSDIIHTHLSNDLWAIVPALKLAGCNTKLFLTKCMESGIVKKDIFHRYLYNRVHKIFAVSNFIKENVLKTCPVDESKVVILHDSISLKQFDPAAYNKSDVRKELGLAEADVVIGIVGRMTPGKGHEVFFESARLLLESKKYQHLKFVVVGAASYGEEKYEEELMKIAKDKKLMDFLIFYGYQKNIPYYLSAMDILAFPSNEESFGGTVLEAMAMKLPVAASNSGGVKDIVADGETGFLFERNDPASLAEALEKLIDDHELRNTLGVNGRKRVEEHFEIVNNMKILEGLYGS